MLHHVIILWSLFQDHLRRRVQVRHRVCAVTPACRRIKLIMCESVYTDADASTKPVLMSLVSIESTQIEEPPPYNAAMQYPVCFV